MRDFIRLLQLAGLLGCGLSILGLGLSIYFQVKFLMNPPPAVVVEPANWVTGILAAFREPGTTFLLSALLFVVCDIALRSTHRPPPADFPPGAESH
jgi:multisubunit Na+/H+ antiporter MnhB subunit